MPLKPSVQVHQIDRLLLAEFWDCHRLDPAPIRELHRRFEQHLLQGGRSDLIIDLQGVGFAGSAVLGGFLNIHRLATKSGGQIVFCHVDPTVMDVFRVSRIEQFFGFASDRAAALERVNATPSATEASPPAASPSPQAASPPKTSGPGPLRRPRKDPKL